MEAAQSQTVARVIIMRDTPGNNMSGGHSRAALGREQAHAAHSAGVTVSFNDDPPKGN